MPSWLEFSLLDMTPYDQRTWLRLIETYQHDYPWMPWLALASSGFLIWLLVRQPKYAVQLVILLLAVAWLWSGSIFQMNYHAKLNWAASYFGWAFIVQGVLLIPFAIFTTFNPKPALVSLTFKSSWPGLLLILLALIYPLLGYFEGRSVQQFEWLGMMPTPTALATIGVLMLLSSRWRYLLLIIPVGWILTSTAFSSNLDLWEPYITGLAVLAFVLHFPIRVKASC